MTALLPPESIRRLTGFGQSTHSDGYVFQPTSASEILGCFEVARTSGRRVTIRGAARSYGDAATGAENIVLEMTAMNRILSWDPESGVIEAEPGATLEDLWIKTLPDGWYLPVVSGTTKTSLGGALAMNIHGKNNWMRGPLGEHVLGFDLVSPNGQTVCCGPEDSLFTAAISGLGLLGVMTQIKLQMKKIGSGDVRVRAVSCRSWKEQFAAFQEYEGRAEYVVSWIDCFARGEASGRGILHVAWPAEDAPSTLRLDHQSLPTKIMGVFPKSSVWKILRLFNNRFGMRCVNMAKHHAGKMFEHGKEHLQSLAAFNFLLDYVPGWEKAYLPGGLIQCQFFVPKDAAQRVFAELIALQQDEKLESFLAVMKRHRPDRFLLSHAVDGYSLALDFKVTETNRARLFNLALKMNDLALASGGRFYFAKDSTLNASQAHAFLGDALERFNEIKRGPDPEGLLTSDLAERLRLIS